MNLCIPNVLVLITLWPFFVLWTKHWVDWSVKFVLKLSNQKNVRGSFSPNLNATCIICWRIEIISAQRIWWIKIISLLFSLLTELVAMFEEWKLTHLKLLIYPSLYFPLSTQIPNMNILLVNLCYYNGFSSHICWCCTSVSMLLGELKQVCW